MLLLKTTIVSTLAAFTNGQIKNKKNGNNIRFIITKTKASTIKKKAAHLGRTAFS
jgi:hypothetical protein